jgi:hypothetical protein
VHISKELAIFPNSHTKYDQGVIATHNRHWVDILCFSTKYLGKSATFIFLASEMGHRMDALRRVG